MIQNQSLPQVIERNRLTKLRSRVAGEQAPNLWLWPVCSTEPMKLSDFIHGARVLLSAWPPCSPLTFMLFAPILKRTPSLREDSEFPKTDERKRQNSDVVLQSC